MRIAGKVMTWRRLESLYPNEAAVYAEAESVFIEGHDLQGTPLPEMIWIRKAPSSKVMV